MTSVVVPVRIDRSTRIDREDLCSSLKCYLSKTSGSAANFENFLSRKVSRPTSLPKKTLFRKAHAINGVELNSRVLIPFKAESRRDLVWQYKAGYESTYLESMLSSTTYQRGVLNPVAFLFCSPFYLKTSITRRANQMF